MKRKSTAIVSIALMTLCFAFSGTRLSAQSQSEEKGPVRVTASLAEASTVCLGEPILLNYDIKNSSELPVSVYTKDTQDNSLGRQTFTEGGGKLLVPSASVLVPHHRNETLTMYAGVNLAGYSSRSVKALANARITFPHPGSYILRVHVEWPYMVGDPQQGTRYVLKSDFMFPLNVVAADPAYLHSATQRLRGGIVRTTDAEEKATLVQALFSMPESAASSSWQLLIEEPKLDGTTLNVIGTALEGLQTNRAADLLAEMLWEPVQSSDTVAEAAVLRHFYAMYDAGTPAVKKHIEDLHKQHGVAMAKIRIE